MVLTFLPGFHPEVLPLFNTPAFHTQDQPCSSSAKVSPPAALGSSPGELQQENTRPHLRVSDKHRAETAKTKRQRVHRSRGTRGR